jgi:hypothetical protein
VCVHARRADDRAAERLAEEKRMREANASGPVLQARAILYYIIYAYIYIYICSVLKI